MEKQKTDDLMGAYVAHEMGSDVGTVIEIRPNISNGRRYVFLKTTYAGVVGPFPADEMREL